ncbi:DUF2752 domain-containing protein [Actinomyces sp. 2119]|uniref:DUF2752 domain-containing protein n=1 Tax=Actinomyces sp. 2119 TaxID=2321393 RepID=UPI0021757F80|nr:DUF2752 domain-containing protein [Actinomyces sp. 2119]
MSPLPVLVRRRARSGGPDAWGRSALAETAASGAAAPARGAGPWRGPGLVVLGVLAAVPALPSVIVLMTSLGRPAEEMDGPDLCMLHRTTGLWCPLCGGTRATRELLSADLSGALSYNPFAVATEVLIVLALVRWLVARCSGRSRLLASSGEMLAYSLAAVLFAVVRNLPGLWAYLGPSLGPGVLG